VPVTKVPSAVNPSERSAPSFIHRYEIVELVGDVAATRIISVALSENSLEHGWSEMTGPELTVSSTLSLVSAGPQLVETTQLYIPACDADSPEINSVAAVTPEYPPPLLKGTPSCCH
jgi:hypothetical protein